MSDATRAEVCAVACAELFRDAGEIMASPMTTVVQIGARLARLTFSPDIVITDGEARMLADTPAIGAPFAVEGWMPFNRVFETLAWGRRHVVMGANQIDRYGNQNLSAFGPLQHPTRQMFGVRGAPGNTINHATSYWVARHSPRVFCEKVGVVYDSVGQSTWQASLNSLKRRGLMVSFGNASGPVTGVDLALLNQKGSLYVTRPSLNGYITNRAELQYASNELFSLIGSGAIRVEVRDDQKFALADAQRAHQVLESRSTSGSSLLIP